MSNRWHVDLVGKDTGQEYSYLVVSLADLTDEQATFKAIAGHGEQIIQGRDVECVLPHPREVRRA